MALSKPTETQRKFVVDYKDASGKVTDRWTYDLDKFRNGPIMTENFELPRKEKVAKKKKQ
jgi:hypothetical protein